jgi:hypothetical protein
MVPAALELGMRPVLGCLGSDGPAAAARPSGTQACAVAMRDAARVSCHTQDSNTRLWTLLTSERPLREGHPGLPKAPKGAKEPSEEGEPPCRSSSQTVSNI